MKATFPHMGNTYIVAKTLLDELNVDYVIPPDNSKIALEIGSRYAPEMACLPLKLNLGNFIQAYEEGADTIVITSSRGPCRYGWYGQMHYEILNENGFNFDVISLELPDAGWNTFLERISRLTGKIRPVQIIRAVKKATEVAVLVDELEKLTFYTRPREIVKGETSRIYQRFRKEVRQCRGAENIKKLISETSDELKELEIDKDKKPLKVGIVGEIFTIIDSYTNFYIEEKLGHLGVEVDRSITVSNWIIEHIIKKVLPVRKDLAYSDAAKGYLNVPIGGHAQETVGNSVLFAQKGFDGIIQMYPLTCMPEIVAESILPSVERDFDVPVLTLIVDEMTGEAGYITRIEAFIDLLTNKKLLANKKQVEGASA